MKQKVEELEEDLKEEEDPYDDLDSKINELEDRIGSEIQPDIDDVQQRVEEIQESLSHENEERIDELEDQTEDITSQIEGLEGNISDIL